MNIFKVEQSNDLRFREVTVRVRYGCSPATVLRGSATFNLVSHCQLKVCMYRAIKKALPLSVCETDTTTVVEVDKGQRFITSVNYVLLIRSSYRSRIANIRIHFEFAKKIIATSVCLNTFLLVYYSFRHISDRSHTPRIGVPVWQPLHTPFRFLRRVPPRVHRDVS